MNITQKEKKMLKKWGILSIISFLSLFLITRGLILFFDSSGMNMYQYLVFGVTLAVVLYLLTRSSK